jgi:hypothetical protein
MANFKQNLTKFIYWGKFFINLNLRGRQRGNKVFAYGFIKFPCKSAICLVQPVNLQPPALDVADKL